MSSSSQDLTPDCDLISVCNLTPDCDLAPNQINNISTRLCKVKEFLQKNSKEQAITAACIYNLPESTLWSSIQSTKKIHDKHNKLLQKHEKNAIHQFIWSLLACHIQSMSQLIYNVICNLKHAQNSIDFRSSSLSWFRKWWKQNDLHRIKTKSLAAVWLTAQWEEKIIQWFKEYQAIMKKYEIKRRNIVNFDEADFCVSCLKD
jgi:hypothetical protein